MKSFYLVGGLTLIGVAVNRFLKISGVNNEFDKYFKISGLKNGVAPRYLKAISMNESFLGEYQNTVTVNGNTTGGLMHIELPTARDYVSQITPGELLIPGNEIEIASRHFKVLLNRYNNDLELAVRAYNGGMGRVDQYLDGLAPMQWVENTNEYWARFQRNLNKIS